MSDNMQAVCDSEVSNLLLKKAITEVTDGSKGFVCSFLCVPKKSEGFRPIVNLKPLNKYIECEHFKMENLETVRYLVREGDWLIKIDLKDAYLTVPVVVFMIHKKSFSAFHGVGGFISSVAWPLVFLPPPEFLQKLLK